MKKRRTGHLIQSTVEKSTKAHVEARAANEGRSVSSYVRRLLEQDETDWRRMQEAVERGERDE